MMLLTWWAWKTPMNRKREVEEAFQATVSIFWPLHIVASSIPLSCQARSPWAFASSAAFKVTWHTIQVSLAIFCSADQMHSLSKSSDTGVVKAVVSTLRVSSGGEGMCQLRARLPLTGQLSLPNCLKSQFSMLQTNVWLVSPLMTRLYSRWWKTDSDTWLTQPALVDQSWYCAALKAAS